MVEVKNLCCPFTGSANFQKVFEYRRKPEGEVQYPFNAGPDYHREIWQCVESQHYLSVHDMDLSSLYSQEYVDSTYRDKTGVRMTFERIIALAPDKSDNAGRVERIGLFARDYFKTSNPWTVLDVGSGLGVFPHGIKKAGWECIALDPDKRACRHIEEAVGIEAVCADFLTYDTDRRFDLITLNKVLEHVEDPITMLKRTTRFLKPDGFIYIEVPDGEKAAVEGRDREEFFIEHIHIFSFLSTLLLGHKAGLNPIVIERLQEPSTKYTLRAFFNLK